VCPVFRFITDALNSLLPNTTNWGGLTFPATRVFVAIGANQVLLEKAVFSNFMITTPAGFESPDHSANLTSADITGSASSFAPDLEFADQLWIYMFARRCDGVGYCRELDTQAINFTEPVYFLERNYLQKETAVGPAPEEVIPSMVLSFDFPTIQSFEDSKLSWAII
jgi:hypothetical protein